MVWMNRAKNPSKTSNNHILHIYTLTHHVTQKRKKRNQLLHINLTPSPHHLTKKWKETSTWSCPAESRTVSEECLSVTWWTSSLCFSLRMVSSWSPSCSASNRAATRDCGLWRIGTRIPPGRSFRDLLRGTYVGGVLGALVILRMASASTKAVSCCVDRITGTIPATCTCTSHCQNPRTSEMLQQTCSSLVRSPCDWDVESC